MQAHGTVFGYGMEQVVRTGRSFDDGIEIIT
jgi:hypothetical protein